MDQAYRLFADIHGGEGWHFNRKIAEDGDVPTGDGINISAFDGANFDDGGPHQMQILADGRTATLILDGLVGAQVKFPFLDILLADL